MLNFGKQATIGILHASPLNRLLGNMKDHSIILGLHRVIQSDQKLLNRRIEHMTSETLEEIVHYLLYLGYQFSSLTDLVEMRNSKKVAITFDDGFKDIYQNTYPVLKKNAIPFTVFLTTATVGSRKLLWQHKLYAALDALPPEKQVLMLCKFGLIEYNRQSLFELLNALFDSKTPDFLESLVLKISEEAGLTAEEEMKQAESMYLDEGSIREMAKNGIEIHAHGHAHWSLPTLNREQTEAEIDRCMDTIEEMLGTKPMYYAPAFGKSNQYLQSLCRERKIKAVIGADAGFIQQKSMNYILPRIMTVDVLGLSIKLTKIHLNNIFPFCKKGM